VRRRFADSTVRTIRHQYRLGCGLKKLADFHVVNRKVIYDIVHGLTYKDVGGPITSGVRRCRNCGQRIVGAQHETKA
jgi:hypothetical protein